MAAKKQKKKKADSPEGIDVKLVPEVTENTPFYYSNHISVGHTRFDFTLSLLRVPTTLKPEQMEMAEKGKPVPMEAALQIIISPPMISRLIDALSNQKDNYEKRFGNIEKGKK